MVEYSTLYIPTVLNLPIKLIDIIYNCPVCDYEIEIDILVGWLIIVFSNVTDVIT
ncbi:hypothetical protein BC749_101873 [Flavobacterium araucananum]|nr:hypothetical protein BC749_101873 [Flavobacterium araucananum]